MKGADRVNVWTAGLIIAVIASSTVATSVDRADAQAAPVTVRAAVDAALSQHPFVAAAQQALAAAQARLAQAQAGQNIHVVLSAGSSYGNAVSTGGVITTGPSSTSSSAAVSASLQIVNEQTRYQVRQAEAAVASAQAGLAAGPQGPGVTAAPAHFTGPRTPAGGINPQGALAPA